MSIVKIQTLLPSNFGCKVIFDKYELKFDKLGFAEVESQEIADALAINYDGWLFVGEVPVKVAAPVSENTKELEDTLARAKDMIETREATIEALQKECDEWKAQVNLYKKQSEDATEELEGFKVQSGKIVDELNLKVSLAGKTNKELIEFCQTLEIPEERFKGAVKDDLITIILDESRNK